MTPKSPVKEILRRKTAREKRRTDIAIDEEANVHQNPNIHPPKPAPEERRKRKGKKTRRAGAKHQRHYRAVQDPFKRTHRPLKGSSLELASSLARPSAKSLNRPIAAYRLAMASKDLASFPENPDTEESEKDKEEERERIRESLASRPKPSAPCEINVMEAKFWEHRCMPAGLVLLITVGETEEKSAEVAVPVKKAEHSSNGVWIDVKLLGASTVTEYEAAKKRFRSRQKRVHLCYPQTGEDGNEECPIIGENGTHLKRCPWYPPGDFTAEWIGSAAKKAIREGVKMMQEEEEGNGKAPQDGSAETN